LESLAIGKPVIIWKPFQYPTNSDAYSDIPSDVVRRVVRLEDLERAIQELLKSPKRDYKKYEYFLAQNHSRLINWVKNSTTNSKITLPDEPIAKASRRRHHLGAGGEVL
jgi:spore germination protein GerM